MNKNYVSKEKRFTVDISEFPSPLQLLAVIRCQHGFNAHHHCQHLCSKQKTKLFTWWLLLHLYRCNYL